MHIILGGTGHVGSATAATLLERGEPVTIVTRDAEKGEELKRKGARIAVADVGDAEALRSVLRQGRRLFVINPPADPATDTDLEERRTVASILAAIDGSDLEAIVAESTYGAQPGQRCGDLSVLHGLEQGLHAQPIPVSIIRAAYYMSNWDASLETARDEGIVRTFYPADFALPMVAPQDIGEIAAGLLTEPAGNSDLNFIEGPERYAPSDVAAAFSQALGKPVRVDTVRRDRWVESFRSMGFSEPAAQSYARMTAVSLDGGFAMPEAPIRGSVSLQAYISALVSR